MSARPLATQAEAYLSGQDDGRLYAINLGLKLDSVMVGGSEIPRCNRGDISRLFRWLMAAIASRES